MNVAYLSLFVFCLVAYTQNISPFIWGHYSYSRYGWSCV